MDDLDVATDVATRELSWLGCSAIVLEIGPRL
jgi:hypothetical protein